MEAAIKHEELTEKSSVVKLPKLTIMSWVPFESQFTAIFHDQNVPCSTQGYAVLSIICHSMKKAIRAPWHICVTNTGELLTLYIPPYMPIASQLHDVHLEHQSMDHLPVRITRGANEYAQIRTCVPMRIGHRGELMGNYGTWG